AVHHLRPGLEVDQVDRRRRGNAAHASRADRAHDAPTGAAGWGGRGTADVPVLGQGRDPLPRRGDCGLGVLGQTGTHAPACTCAAARPTVIRSDSGPAREPTLEVATPMEP